MPDITVPKQVIKKSAAPSVGVFRLNRGAALPKIDIDLE